MKLPSFPALLLSIALSFASAAVFAQNVARFKAIPLNIGIHVVQAEVAATPTQREHGLMYREKLGANQGMVFLFAAPTTICMWMKNTFIPLSVAFINDEGKIVNIEDMQPKSTKSHCAKRPVKYALEMNQGWFARKNIKSGTVVDGLPR